MADRTSSDKAGEKSFFARTAKNTTKRAKRAQEKVKRKLGKAEETKDEIFDRFVDNFHNQQDAVQRLEQELKNYINCVKAMMNANQLFSEAVKAVYESEWSERDEFVNLLDTIHVHWNNLMEKLQDEVLEPLTCYQTPFSDIKNRISKRNRKLVDYDRHRHHVETLKVKGGKAADPKKLSQAEDDYNQAKSVYLQLHSDLYDELPAIYDSRIPFYVSSFQSVFAAEGVFHREAAKIKTQMIDMLDILAKENSAGTYSTRRPLSCISNASSDGENSPFEPMDSFAKLDNTDNSDNALSENEEVPSDHIDADPHPVLDQPSPPTQDYPTPPFASSPGNDADPHPTPEQPCPPTQDEPVPVPSDIVAPRPPTPPQRPPPPTMAPETNTPDRLSPSEQSPSTPEQDEVALTEAKVGEEELLRDSEQEKSSEEEQEPETGNQASRALYKVIATHPYTGEDEDELTFDKGEVIQVIMYDKTDDPDEGWLMGVIDGTGAKGVFPENFTKKLA